MFCYRCKHSNLQCYDMIVHHTACILLMRVMRTSLWDHRIFKFLSSCDESESILLSPSHLHEVQSTICLRYLDYLALPTLPGLFQTPRHELQREVIFLPWFIEGGVITQNVSSQLLLSPDHCQGCLLFHMSNSLKQHIHNHEIFWSIFDLFWMWWIGILQRSVQLEQKSSDIVKSRIFCLGLGTLLTKNSLAAWIEWQWDWSNSISLKGNLQASAVFQFWLAWSRNAFPLRKLTKNWFDPPSECPACLIYMVTIHLSKICGEDEL